MKWSDKVYVTYGALCQLLLCSLGSLRNYVHCEKFAVVLFTERLILVF